MGCGSSTPDESQSSSSLKKHKSHRSSRDKGPIHIQSKTDKASDSHQKSSENEPQQPPIPSNHREDKPSNHVAKTNGILVNGKSSVNELQVQQPTVLVEHENDHLNNVNGKTSLASISRPPSSNTNTVASSSFLGTNNTAKTDSLKDPSTAANSTTMRNELEFASNPGSVRNSTSENGGGIINAATLYFNKNGVPATNHEIPDTHHDVLDVDIPHPPLPGTVNISPSSPLPPHPKYYQ